VDRSKVKDALAIVDVLMSHGRSDLVEFFLTQIDPPKGIAMYVHPEAHAALERMQKEMSTLIDDTLNKAEPTKPKRHKWKPRRYFNG
jgi:hypothetical protein